MYRTGDSGGQSLVWVGRDGKPLETVSVEERDGELSSPRLSPDGTRFAVERIGADVSDVWVYEIARKRWQKLTSTPGREGSPVWSHDGQWVAYAAERGGSTQIYRIQANGAGQEQQLTDGANTKVPRDWSRDGRFLIYSEIHPQNQSDPWILPLDAASGRPGKPIEFLTTPANDVRALFSGRQVDCLRLEHHRPGRGVCSSGSRRFPG